MLLGRLPVAQGFFFGGYRIVILLQAPGVVGGDALPVGLNAASCSALRATSSSNCFRCPLRRSARACWRRIASWSKLSGEAPAASKAMSTEAPLMSLDNRRMRSLLRRSTPRCTPYPERGPRDSRGVVDVFAGEQVGLLLASDAFGTIGVRLLPKSLGRCGFHGRVGAVLPAAPEFWNESSWIALLSFLDEGTSLRCEVEREEPGPDVAVGAPANEGGAFAGPCLTAVGRAGASIGKDWLSCLASGGRGRFGVLAPVRA